MLVYAGFFGFCWFMLFFVEEHILVDEASHFSYLGFHFYIPKLGLVNEASILGHFPFHWNVISFKCSFFHFIFVAALH